ncbi:hypothetical protein CS022_04225 [Veronia nyctiphanis]|uniref:NADH:ubiquinone oxidoreductase intermediate-associated protein 30 domain-containing protein n=1 Tax=Veronia nyctiphanis TaxID=1278244 RepID=A0A4Q0YSS2_9GAMM|nr:hypothetical protein CS022_04225 [Veronia nyctiphanis]
MWDFTFQRKPFTGKQRWLCSVRRFAPLDLRSVKQYISLKVKGDGRQYQFRVRTTKSWDGVSYRAVFQTVKDQWVTITIGEDDFVPVFRGRRVINVPEFNFADSRQMGLMLADKTPGAFHLELAEIGLDSQL